MRRFTRKKISKSKETVIWTFVIGLIINLMIGAKFIIISGIKLFDKFIVKLLLSGLFLLSTRIIGVGYKMNVIKGRSQGGKARIIVYVLLILLFIPILPVAYNYFSDALRIIVMCVVTAFILFNAGGLIYVLLSLFRTKRNPGLNSIAKAVVQQDKMAIAETKHEKLAQAEHEKPALQAKTINDAVPMTLYELCDKYLSEDSNCVLYAKSNYKKLKWVKIQKKADSNGDIYGYIMMDYYTEPKYRRIYFPEKREWEIVDMDNSILEYKKAKTANEEKKRIALINQFNLIK